MDIDAVKVRLRRKITTYEANGNTILRDNARQILQDGQIPKLMSVTAGAPTGRVSGSGRRMRLRDLPTPVEKRTRDSPYTLSSEGLPALLERMMDDPTFAADIHHQLRRPRGVNKREHGISGRKAVAEPMLNAKPDSVARGLAYREPSHKDRLVKGALYDRLVVKPTCIASAKAEHSSPFWGERLWNIYTLRYARGFVIVTDKGSESMVFHSYGELKAAVRKSGWEILR